MTHPSQDAQTQELPPTEARNPASERIDTLSPLEIVRLMNAEDARVPAAVGREAENIARAVEAIAQRLRTGGRLIYISPAAPHHNRRCVRMPR